jgi:hypothetical protein
VSTEATDTVQHIELTTPLHVQPGQHLGVLNLDPVFCSVRYRGVTANEPPSLYGGDCSSSAQFFTGEWCEVNQTFNTLCVQWHMESGDGDDGLGRSLVPSGTTAFEVVGTNDPVVNGLYTSARLEDYSGPDAYRKQNTNLVMFRWERAQWVLADLGPSLDRFREQASWLYRCPESGSSATPPVDVLWERVPPRSDLPQRLEVFQAIQMVRRALCFMMNSPLPPPLPPLRHVGFDA